MIPSFRYNRKPAHKEINTIFKEKFDALEIEYKKAVTDIIRSCVHQWGAWEHRWHNSVCGGFTKYERECQLCGFMQKQDEMPMVDYPIKDTRDSIIDVY